MAGLLDDDTLSKLDHETLWRMRARAREQELQDLGTQPCACNVSAAGV